MPFKHTTQVLGELLKKDTLARSAKAANKKRASDTLNNDASPSLLQDPLLQVVFDGLTLWKNVGLRFVPANLSDSAVNLTETFRQVLKDDVNLAAMQSTFKKLAERCLEYQPPVTIINFYRAEKAAIEAQERVNKGQLLPAPTRTAQPSEFSEIVSFLKENNSELTVIQRTQTANAILTAAKNKDQDALNAQRQQYPALFAFLRQRREELKNK